MKKSKGGKMMKMSKGGSVMMAGNANRRRNNLR